MKTDLYKVTLTDEFGSVPYEIARDEVGNFINGINWEHVYTFAVEPIPPMAEWEVELLKVAAEVSEVRDNEWRPIESLATKSLEINRRGVVRHNRSKRVMHPIFDVDNLNMAVRLKINGQITWINGPKLAETMWREG